MLTSRVKTRYGNLEVFTQNDLICDFLRLYGEWSYIETAFINSILKVGERILDGGGFLGTFSLGIKESLPEFILAIEPNPSAYTLLRKNLRKNLQCPFAVENCFISNGGTKIQDGCLKINDNLGSMSYLNSLESEAEKGKDKSSARSLTLKELRIKYGPFSFIKLDIEGGEVSALISDADYLAKAHPIIWVECNEDIRSIELFTLLKSLHYKVYFFCYSAFNPNNFNGKTQKIFPVAFEAGLLAAPFEKEISCPEALTKTGAKLKLLESEEDLKRSLWLTPRWGKEEWTNLSITELQAICTRISKGENFSTFLIEDLDKPKCIPQIHSPSATELRVDSLDTNASSPSLDLAPHHDKNRRSDDKYLKNIYANSQIELLQTSDEFAAMEKKIQNIEANFMSNRLSFVDMGELFLSLTLIDKYIDNLKDASQERNRLRYHELIIKIIENSYQLTNFSLFWRNSLYRKNLLMASIIYDEHASKVKESDAISATLLWASSITYLKQLYSIEPMQEKWVNEMRHRQLIEAAMLCDQLATKRKESDEEAASKFWSTGIDYLNQLYTFAPLQEEWVAQLLRKQLIESIVICDKIATKNKGDRDEFAAQYWSKSIAYANQLYALSPTQDAWLEQLRFKQLLEVSVVLDKLASNSGNQDEEMKYQHLLAGVTYLSQLYLLYPTQDAWVGLLRCKLLLEATVVSDRLATKYKFQDAGIASKYWTAGIQHINDLFELVPKQDEWVEKLRCKLLLEAAVICDKLAVKKLTG